MKTLLIFLATIFIANNLHSQDYVLLKIYFAPQKKYDVSYKIYINNIQVGQLKSNQLLTCKLYNFGKSELKLDGYSGKQRITDIDCQQIIFTSAAEKYLLQIYYDDEIWKLKQVNSEMDFVNYDNPVIFNFEGVKPTLSNNVTISKTEYNPPLITINYPKLDINQTATENTDEITLQGLITDENEITKCTLNDENLPLSQTGTFSKNITLVQGDNRFTIKTIDKFNNTSELQFTVTRKTRVVTNQTTYSVTEENTGITGTYYALLIANNNYTDPNIPTLNEPINDATKLYNTLTTFYTFNKENVLFLKNATYEQMISAFDDLANKITPNDNILIFYAGHGWWDDLRNLGYWLPVDAKQSNTAFWIPNSRISDYMSSIKSKHTLLIADACFSGSIFKTRSAFSDAQPSINKLYAMPSKKAMTSGNLKVVPDKSVFLQYLVKRLNDNPEKYISSDMLFASFRTAVLNNSPTEPQYGTIQNAGDEGGEFIFIRK